MGVLNYTYLIDYTMKYQGMISQPLKERSEDLEMNRFLVVLFFVISCSACTSSKNMHKGDMYELILKKISEPSKEDQIKISSKDIKKNLTRDQLDKINVPLLLVEIQVRAISYPWSFWDN